MEKNSRKVTIGATGDILLHDRVYNKARLADGSYDFSEMLSEAKPLFKKEHLIIANQESIIGGEELGVSSFPHFNSPIEIGYQLKELNIDIANMANNHVMDKGEEGILKAIENWEKIGMPYVGAYKSVEDRNTLRIFHRNGLKICFLAFTRSMGTVKRPKDKEYLAGNFADFGVKWTRRLINRIKGRGYADIVVLSMHFGTEYAMLPTGYQVETASSLSDTGADIIIGHHPHVLQPPATIFNSKGEETFVAYSLGNFFSGQKGIYRQIGAYMTVDVEKPEGSKMTKISNPKFTLTYVDSGENKDYKLHLLRDVVNRQKTIKTDIGEFDSQEVYDRMRNHMRHFIPDLDIS